MNEKTKAPDLRPFNIDNYAGVYNSSDTTHIYTYGNIYPGHCVVTTRAIADSFLENFPDRFEALDPEVVEDRITQATDDVPAGAYAVDFERRFLDRVFASIDEEDDEAAVVAQEVVAKPEPKPRKPRGK